jgi:hypothetical protein
VGRVTSTPKLPVTGGGGGDAIGEAVGETSGEADGVASEDAVAEGLAGGVGDAFAWEPFPPPHPDRRTATVSSNVESLMRESSTSTQLCAWSYVSGTIQHLKQGPTLTLRARLKGVRNDGRLLLSVLFICLEEY